MSRPMPKSYNGCALLEIFGPVAFRTIRHTALSAWLFTKSCQRGSERFSRIAVALDQATWGARLWIHDLVPTPPYITAQPRNSLTFKMRKKNDHSYVRVKPEMSESRVWGSAPFATLRLNEDFTSFNSFFATNAMSVGP